MNSDKISSNRNITFDSLPEAVITIIDRLNKIELLLTATNAADDLTPPINTKDLCKFLNVTEPTISRYRKNGKIPFYYIGSHIRYDLKKVVSALENKRRNNG
jgi:excisionase family DNA binding protein